MEVLIDVLLDVLYKFAVYGITISIVGAVLCGISWAANKCPLAVILPGTIILGGVIMWGLCGGDNQINGTGSFLIGAGGVSAVWVVLAANV